MKVIRGIRHLKLKKPTVATVGVFDGIHRGHRKILKLLRERAQGIGAQSCVITFDPHPSKILHPDKAPPMLVSTEHKLRLIGEEEVDIVALVRFTRRFANIIPAHFAKTVAGRLNVKELLVGENFGFGKNKRGKVSHLKQLGLQFGFKVRVVPSLKDRGRIISSTLIRRLIISGRMREAERLLGRKISVLGTVAEGARRGRILGFPTANIDPHHEAIPPSGVYIVKVELEDRMYRGILNIGFRPTFGETRFEKEPTVEVYIFGFRKPIYGKEIEVIFLKRIRNERRFGDRKDLLLRIRKDVEIAKKYFRDNMH